METNQMIKNKLKVGILILICLASSAIAQDFPQDSTQKITDALVLPVAKPGEDEGALILAERCLALETGRDDHAEWCKLTNNCQTKADGAQGTIVHIQTALTYSDGSVTVGRIRFIASPAQIHAVLAPPGTRKALTGILMIVERIQTPAGDWVLDTPDGSADAAAVVREAAKLTDGNYENLGRDALPPMVWKPKSSTERKQ
jgi:hypothetical protein